MPAVIGLDIGTTIIKAHLIDSNGEPLGSATSEPITMRTPQPRSAEQDPEELWARVVDVLSSVSRIARSRAVEISGVSMACQSGSLLAIGPDDHPLTPLMTWMDTRAADIVLRWKTNGDDAFIRSRSGWSVAPGLGLSMIAWLREQAPPVYSKARKFVSADSFLAHRLTGQWVTNRSNAAGTQLIDVENGTWSVELCDLAGIEVSALPGIGESGTILGSIMASATAATGLPAGLPVINGGHDQACTALALGVVSPDDLLLASGTAWVLTGVVATPDAAGRDFNVSHHVVGGRWTASRFLGPFGGAMESLVEANDSAGNQMSRSERYAMLDRQLSKTPLSDDSLATAARSLMETSAFEAEMALADLSQSTERPTAITLVGGATASPIWPRIISDVTQTTIAQSERDSEPAIGAAMLAASAAGFDPWSRAQYLSRIEPDRQVADKYALRLSRYQALKKE